MSSWLSAIQAAGGNTGGTKGPSTPAGVSTQPPVMAPMEPNRYGLPPFPVDDSDFDQTVVEYDLQTGKIIDHVSMYLCATGAAATRLLPRLNQLPGIHAAPILIDPLQIGNNVASLGNGRFQVSALVPGYQFSTPAGNDLGWDFAGSLLKNYQLFTDDEADYQVVEAYGVGGVQQKDLGVE